MRRGFQRRVVCGLNTHGCKPVLRNALGLGLEHDSGGVAMPLSKRRLPAASVGGAVAEWDLWTWLLYDLTATEPVSE